MALTAAQIIKADELFCEHRNNTQQIATLLGVTEAEVERALHIFWGDLTAAEQSDNAKRGYDLAIKILRELMGAAQKPE